MAGSADVGEGSTAAVAALNRATEAFELHLGTWTWNRKFELQRAV